MFIKDSSQTCASFTVMERPLCACVHVCVCVCVHIHSHMAKHALSLWYTDLTVLVDFIMSRRANAYVAFFSCQGSASLLDAGH